MKNDFLESLCIVLLITAGALVLGFFGVHLMLAANHG